MAMICQVATQCMIYIVQSGQYTKEEVRLLWVMGHPQFETNDIMEGLHLDT